MHATHPAVGAARIGPNALIQTVAALEEERGPQETRRFLRRIGRGDLAERPPTHMVDELAFISLIGAIRADVGVAAAGRILARSGERTAAYVLANRIPAPARAVLPLLPRRLGLRLLLGAIGGHAWTFAGGGRFSYAVERGGATLRLGSCPECRGMAATEPICRYYEGCFQGLLRPLIDGRIVVREVACAAQGGDACVFEVR
ncbi:MAG TPA: bacteriochlorophyll 4-vinyl reductase [Chloroflexaceae bacterium]|nr:bacteriochlorophyll 4-vinyl reductase [Chloroflexaceae bacterium]